MKELRKARDMLIISTSEKSSQAVAKLISPTLCPSASFAGSGSTARRLISVRSFDLVLINAPLSDEFGHELAMDLARQTTAGILLLVKNDVYDEVSDLVREDGVITISKPISGAFFHQAVQMGIAVSAKSAAQERRIADLKQKLEDSRRISLAKCLLVQYQGISEPEAHRLIEKQAMDSRMSRRDVAEEWIRRYE